MPHKSRKSWTPWKDPICLVAWGAYFLNRLVLVPHFGADFPFLREHFNDSLLIPAALPLLHWARFRAGLRENDSPPSWLEVLGWCAGWSLFFEWFGPRFLHYSVGDWGDVAAYFLGGIVACLWWNWPRKRDTVTPIEGGRIGAAPLS